MQLCFQHVWQSLQDEAFLHVLSDKGGQHIPHINGGKRLKPHVSKHTCKNGCFANANQLRPVLRSVKQWGLYKFVGNWLHIGALCWWCWQDSRKVATWHWLGPTQADTARSRESQGREGGKKQKKYENMNIIQPQSHGTSANLCRSKMGPDTKDSVRKTMGIPDVLGSCVLGISGLKRYSHLNVYYRHWDCLKHIRVPLMHTAIRANWLTWTSYLIQWVNQPNHYLDRAAHEFICQHTMSLIQLHTSTETMYPQVCIPRALWNPRARES